MALDQAVKWWSISSLGYTREVHIIGDWLTLRLTHNAGAALSLLEDRTWVVTLIMLAVTAALVYYHRRAANTLAMVLFGAALGGAIGNLADRLLRDGGWGSGRVVDMIKYGDFFVGNVADIAIVGAATVAILVSWSGRPLMTPRDPAPAPVPVPDEDKKASS